MAELHISKVSKHYGDFKALHNIDIQIENGEFLALVGPSGCGKSTLMNTIAGLEGISDGQIRMANKDVTNLAPKDRDIAMVFQSYALYPSMTVYQNIAFALEIRKRPQDEIDKEVKRVARLLKIEHLLERKPAALSGGQRQRVAMGRALAREPKVYLFDEPLSNLDAKLRVQMRTEIKKLHKRLNTTTVYVTHDQVEAMTLADRIAVMKDGHLLQLGTPAEIYSRPVNMFVAGFMGSPAMNFISTTISRNNLGEFVIELTASQQASYSLLLPNGTDYSDWVGREIIMGIRPEHILADPQQLPAVLCDIEVTEPTGADLLITTSVNETEIIARVSPESEVTASRAHELFFDLKKAVFFDPQSQDRLNLASTKSL
jgi:multiple sugar transport system ATP-binding protein